MSSTSSSNAGSSQPSVLSKPGPKPYQSSNPQVVINYNTSISGGQGGSGGEGGVDVQLWCKVLGFSISVLGHPEFFVDAKQF
ncbi:hypothetical protein B0H12DRAFT_1235834 [Mycena haematopus]|nr:hypothetical protein B0H12DRAFT_1235834 [Mycena haematopus]